MIAETQRQIRALANPEQAIALQRFFKTAPGQYGHGDVFLGIKVPVLRSVSKQFVNVSLEILGQLIQSKYHEERMAALLIAVAQFKRSQGPLVREQIFMWYCQNMEYINNWDLVDLSVKDIAGEFLVDTSREILYVWATSKHLWTRRCSIVATAAFIRKMDFEDTFNIAQQLLSDEHDLIHKAVGWMLREVGKRDRLKEESFLRKNYRTMPRTMLRYAIEHFPPELRNSYLDRKVTID
jgi:3-methyladenine DNA glycosylase AlkD